MNPPLSWYLRLPFEVRSLADALAVPKIIANGMRTELARILIDRTPLGGAIDDVHCGKDPGHPLAEIAALFLATKLGDAVIVEISRRYHIARAQEIGCAVYCVWHACDAAKCPPGTHDAAVTDDDAADPADPDGDDS